MTGGSVRSYDYDHYKERLEEYYKNMTSKNLEKLFDLKCQLNNVRSDLKDQAAIKSRCGALVITKLEEAGHWLDDLIYEVSEAEDNSKSV